MAPVLFFDTETTGLPLFKQPFSDPKQPAVIQLGAILYDMTNMATIDEYATYIKIGDTYMHPKAEEAHGITRAKANSEGVDPTEAFIRFYEMSQNAEAMCCHNFNFDFFLLKLLANRVENGGCIEKDIASIFMSEIEEIPFFCTMASSTTYCKLPFPSGKKGYKFPKLIELYQFLFGESFEGAHDALVDVRATLRCYTELVHRGIMGMA